MSWRQTFKKLTSGGGNKGEDTVRTQMMQKAGFQIVRTDQMSERQEKGQRILEVLSYRPPADATTPEKKLEFYSDTFEYVYNVVYKAMQVIYLRSGTNPQFSELTTIVEKCKVWYDIALEATWHRLNSLDELIKTAKNKTPTEAKYAEDKLRIKKEQIVRNFFNVWINIFMKPKVSIMGNMCWMDKDVDIPETIAIQSNQPIQPTYSPTTNEHPKDYKPPTAKQNWGKPKNMTQTNEVSE